jgi:hypothetical protein
LVERNLAKVEVASSSLVSRSRLAKAMVLKSASSRCKFQSWLFAPRGAVAKRLCPGLQIRLVRFDSGPRLQFFWIVGGLAMKRYAGIAQLVERNLAKVEVASSSLVSRSNQKKEA